MLMKKRYILNYDDNQYGAVVARGAVAMPGMVDALGLSGKLGDEVELILAGGIKTKGREFVLPRVEVSGADERDIPAAAVKVSDVGIDGLLGQSFLKRFVYTIDESKEAKLILKPRPAW